MRFIKITRVKVTESFKHLNEFVSCKIVVNNHKNHFRVFIKWFFCFKVIRTSKPHTVRVDIAGRSLGGPRFRIFYPKRLEIRRPDTRRRRAPRRGVSRAERAKKFFTLEMVLRKNLIHTT